MQAMGRQWAMKEITEKEAKKSLSQQWYFLHGKHIAYLQTEIWQHTDL